MSKLFNLKKWLTISEAELYLTMMFGEEVNRADILQLSLDGHLTLSVNFVNSARAWVGEILDSEFFEYLTVDESSTLSLMAKLADEAGITYTKPEKNDRFQLITSERIGDNQHFKRCEFTQIDGIWDLMIGGKSQINLEREIQALKGGPKITLIGEGSIFLKSPAGEVCSLEVEAAEDEIGNYEDVNELFLEESMFYRRADIVPEDGVMCVRTDALQELVRNIEEKTTPPSNSITDTTQRNYELAIGLLTKALADKAGPNCGTKEKPNISGLSELLQVYLPADGVGSLSNKALSISTLRKRLKAGYDSLENI